MGAARGMSVRPGFKPLVLSLPFPFHSEYKVLERVISRSSPRVFLGTCKLLHLQV